MNPSNTNYQGQNLNGTIYISGNPSTNPQIAIAKAPYLLEIHSFYILNNPHSDIFSKITDTLLGVSIGFFINLIAKLVGSKIDSSIPFDTWEIYAFFYH